VSECILLVYQGVVCSIKDIEPEYLTVVEGT
jgi:hypothetical protein